MFNLPSIIVFVGLINASIGLSMDEDTFKFVMPLTDIGDPKLVVHDGKTSAPSPTSMSQFMNTHGHRFEFLSMQAHLRFVENHKCHWIFLNADANSETSSVEFKAKLSESKVHTNRKERYLGDRENRLENENLADRLSTAESLNLYLYFDLCKGEFYQIVCKVYKTEYGFEIAAPFEIDYVNRN